MPRAGRIEHVSDVPYAEDSHCQPPFTPKDMGSTAVANSIPASSPELAKPLLTPQEEQVLIRASNGATVEKVAKKLSLAKEEVEELRNSVIAKYDAPNMAAAVNKAFLKGRLNIKKDPHPRVSLNEKDLVILTGIAAGKSNGEIATSLNTNADAINDYNKRLFKKMGCSGRTHSVRKSYELGIFKLPD
jgi:DNA-binding NarL/FixJ family response regulator